jgi:hypothetical protein
MVRLLQSPELRRQTEIRENTLCFGGWPPVPLWIQSIVIPGLCQTPCLFQREDFTTWYVLLATPVENVLFRPEE